MSFKRAWIAFRNSVYILALCVVALCFFAFLKSYRIMRAFNHLEQNAREVITASELQAWATDLLARNPDGFYFNGRRALTNCPKQLVGLCPETGPVIGSFAPDGTNPPSALWIQWSSGLQGTTGLEIGTTNHIPYNESAHAWQPGVYFYKR